MKKILIFSFVFNIYCLCSQTVPVIDVSKEYLKKSINFQDIADVKYVPLETSDNVLLDGNCKIWHVSDANIVVSNPRQGDIFIFGSDGKIKHKFNHRGQGPGEYLNADQVVFDETNKEVFIYDIKVSPVFLVYSEDGKYKRTIKLPSWNGYGTVEAYNFDDENLLVYERYSMGDVFEKQPYMLLSKKDGTVTLLDITLPQRYAGLVLQGLRTDNKGEPQVDRISVLFNESNNRHYGQDFIIADVSCDTVFQLKRDKSLTPILIRTPSVHRTNQKAFLTYFLKTDKYVIMNIKIRLSENRSEEKALMYNLSNGEINEVPAWPLFRNDDIPFRLFYRLAHEGTTPKNTLVYKLEAWRLCEQHNGIKGELHKIASTIDEEDNPVLMIVKFK